MWQRWQQARALKRQADLWHKHILSVARTPDIYQRGLVEDTLEDRAAMVALIATLVFREWRKFDAAGKLRSDAIYKRIFSGFDHALREEGVGDASIARRVRKLGEVFFGLAQAFDAALSQADPVDAVTAVLRKNLQSDSDKATALAQWLVSVQDALRIDDVENLP